MKIISETVKKIISFLIDLFLKVKKTLSDKIKFAVKYFKIKYVIYTFSGLFVLLFLIIITSAVLRINLVSPEATPLFEDRDGNFLTEGSSEYDKLGF